MSDSMYNQLAKYTDLFYSSKNYKKEVDFILKRIRENNVSGKVLIDVACGSGKHSKIFLKHGYKAYGVDLNQGMLKLAKKNVSKIKLFKQDLRKLNLGMKADVIICMFNSMNYNYSYNQLKLTLGRFYKYLNKNGIIVFDSAFTKDNWMEGYFGVEQFRFTNLDIARINKSSSQKNTGTVDQTYIIFDHGEKTIFENANRIFIFDKKKVKKIMEEMGFKVKLYYNFSDNRGEVQKFPTTVFVGIKK